MSAFLRNLFFLSNVSKLQVLEASFPASLFETCNLQKLSMQMLFLLHWKSKMYRLK